MPEHSRTMFRIMRGLDLQFSDGFMEIVAMVVSLITFFMLVRHGEPTLFPNAIEYPVGRRKG